MLLSRWRGRNSPELPVKPVQRFTGAVCTLRLNNGMPESSQQAAQAPVSPVHLRNACAWVRAIESSLVMPYGQGRIQSGEGATNRIALGLR